MRLQKEKMERICFLFYIVEVLFEFKPNSVSVAGAHTV
jgi:hypothetical protein